MTELLYFETRVLVPESVYDDIQEFISRMKTEDIELAKLGVKGRSKEEILNEFIKIYYK